METTKDFLRFMLVVPMVLFLLVLNILLPAGSLLRSEVTTIGGVVPLTPILVVNIVMLAGALMAWMNVDQANREQKIAIMGSVLAISSVSIIMVCVEAVFLFNQPLLLLLAPVLVGVFLGVYGALLTSFQKSLMVVSGNMLLNVRNNLFGNKSIRGPNRILQHKWLFDQSSQLIPLYDMSNDVTVNEVNTRDMRTVDVTVYVRYALMNTDEQPAEKQWFKVFNIPNRDRTFGTVSAALNMNAPDMMKPAFWAKLFEHLIEQEIERLIREQVYEKLAILVQRGEKCKQFEQHLQQALQAKVAPWGLHVKELSFKKIDLNGKDLHDYEPDEVLNCDRVNLSEYGENGNPQTSRLFRQTRQRKLLGEAEADVRAYAMSKLLRETLKAVKEEMGETAANASAEHIVRAAVNEVMLNQRLELDTGARLDPLEMSQN